MKYLIPFVVIAALAACEPNADGTYGTPGGATWYGSATPDQRRAFFEQTCKDYGFRPGTSRMAQCIADETRDARAHYRRVAYERRRTDVRICYRHGIAGVCH